MKKYYFLFIFTLTIVILFLFCSPVILNKYSNQNNNSQIARNNSAAIISSDNLDYNKVIYSEVPCSNKVHITITEFINNLQCSQYTIKESENLNDILMKYNSTCPLNSSLKLIKSVNKFNSPDEIKAGMQINIPEITFKNGMVYRIVQGDTWTKICNEYYPVYDLNYIMNLLIYVNDLKDTTLPLDTTIFLPKI